MKHSLYAIRVWQPMVYIKNNTEINYSSYLFIGCKGVLRIYIYENDVTEHTLLFSTEEDANAYKEKHFKDKWDYQNMYIVALPTEEI